MDVSLERVDTGSTILANSWRIQKRSSIFPVFLLHVAVEIVEGGRTDVESARWNDRRHDEFDWGEGEDRSITRPLTCDQMQ